MSGDAKVSIWGSGSPLREFMHVDDLADACVFLLKSYSHEDHINVGTGSETSIRELATTLAKAVEYRGELEFDQTKPDGTPRKLMDSNRLRKLGWTPTIQLKDGIKQTYAAYLQSLAAA